MGPEGFTSEEALKMLAEEFVRSTRPQGQAAIPAVSIRAVEKQPENTPR